MNGLGQSVKCQKLVVLPVVRRSKGSRAGDKLSCRPAAAANPEEEEVLRLDAI